MITIKIDTKRLKLKVDGHAQPEESDDYQLICTAASALAQGLAYTVSREEKRIRSIEYRPVPGNLFLKVFPEAEAEDAVRRRFEDYADGLELLARTHSCSITMIRNEARIIAKEDGI